MPIENRSEISSEFRAFAKQLHFRSTSDRDTFFVKEPNDVLTILGLIKENDSYRVDFGIRPHPSFNSLADCFSAELPEFVPNPFLEKWCVLAWFPISPSFSSTVPDDRLGEILMLVQREIEVIREDARNRPLEYWADLAWKQKKFDGLSRYTLVYIFIDLGKIDIARSIISYFTLMTRKDELSAYHRKLSRIFDRFDIPPDRQDEWRVGQET